MSALRPERYTFFERLQAEGRLLASGWLSGGDLGDGLLVLDAAHEAQARELLAPDPYAREGYVVEMHVAPWNPSVGTWIGSSTS